MKTWVLIATFLLTAAIGHTDTPTTASGKPTVKKHKKVVVKKSDLQTDVRFDDSVLHGQYQTPDEALAKVENEKLLNDLLGPRKHFKDRLQTASEQE